VKNYLFLIRLAIAFGFSVLAYAAGTGAPDAGSILQQTKPTSGNAPLTKIPKIKSAPEQKPPVVTSSETFMLQRIEITGNTVFETFTLNSLVSNAVGKRQSISQIFELAARITDFYQVNGYPLSRAIIPEQAIQQGKLTIKVIEARFGKITIKQ
jgi:hemolysin activation/secretion protein